MIGRAKRVGLAALAPIAALAALAALAPLVVVPQQRPATSRVSLHVRTPAEDRALAAYDNMTRRERIAQLVMTSVPGTQLSSPVARRVRELHLGGVIVFGHNYRSRAQLRAYDAALQRAAVAGNGAGVRLLVAVDQEGGAVRRLPDSPPRRSAQQLGQLEVGASRRAGAAAGLALRRVGINLNLAPVADLDIGPAHVMRGRSFGARPRRVGERVRAFLRGLHDSGVGATLKHYPGLGGASRNTDDGVAVVRRSRDELARDRTPFAMGVAAGADAVMTSHALYPGLGGRRPFTISRTLVTAELRVALGDFDGVVVTDSLNAAGLRNASGLTTPKACAAAIDAGADIALVTGSLGTAADCARAIRRAIDDGTIPRWRLRESVLRVLELKVHRGLVPAQ